MNSSDLVFRYIDDYYRNAAIRPKMYFRSPECYENVVQAFEGLRDEILDIENALTNPRHTYADYLVASGFGSATFTTRYKESHPKERHPDEEFYKAYSEFLMEYLKWSRGK